jgi:hypothetical protein
VKLRLGAGVAVTAIIAAVGSGLAGDRPHGAGTQSRPPVAAVPPDRHTIISAARTKVRDEHVFEFLRWKDRLRAEASRVPSGN